MFAPKKSDPSNSKISARASRSLRALRAHVCPPHNQLLPPSCPPPPLFKSWCRHCIGWSHPRIDGVVVIGGLKLAALQYQQKYFLDRANVNSARAYHLPRHYNNGILIQAGSLGGLKGYILTDYRLKVRRSSTGDSWGMWS